MPLSLQGLKSISTAHSKLRLKLHPSARSDTARRHPHPDATIGTQCHPAVASPSAWPGLPERGGCRTAAEPTLSTQAISPQLFWTQTSEFAVGTCKGTWSRVALCARRSRTAPHSQRALIPGSRSYCLASFKSLLQILPATFTCACAIQPLQPHVSVAVLHPTFHLSVKQGADQVLQTERLAFLPRLGQSRSHIKSSIFWKPHD